MATTVTRSEQRRRTSAGTDQRPAGLATGRSGSTRLSAHRISVGDRAPGTQTRPSRTTRTARPTRVAHPARPRRVGSKHQPVSVRGRRVVEHKYPSKTARLIAIAVFAAAVGIGVVMWVSGLTTAQTFEITDAQKKSTTLSNEIESLERDAEHAKSGANLAKEASKLGMVAPDQSGVLDARGEEVVDVRQPGVGEDRPVTDVNSESRPRGATSNPDKTNNVAGLAPQEAVVAGVGADVAAPPHSSQNNSTTAGNLPYSNSQRSPTAPAPAAPPA